MRYSADRFHHSQCYKCCFDKRKTGELNMYDDCVYKIKDSVDLFLSNDTYILAYYMNTRQKKSFRVNTEAVYLLENIDGVKNVGEIKEFMYQNYGVETNTIDNVLAIMEKNRIITVKNVCTDILSVNEKNRYSRQINYFAEFLNSEEDGIKAQKKIIDSKVLIFGVGAVGGDVAFELAMAGVKHITLYDFDSVEKSDVARHMGYRDDYVGKNKAEALANELKKINNEIIVNIVCEGMKPETNVEHLIEGYDFVVNTLDEPYIGYTSAKISRICVKYKIPHYIAGGFDAHLASTGELVIPYVTPCVECYADYFKESLKNWKPKKHPVTIRYTEIGGLSCMSLFSASYACIEIIKCLAGLVRMEDNYKIRGEFLFNNMSLTYLSVKRNRNCPICGVHS